MRSPRGVSGLGWLVLEGTIGLYNFIRRLAYAEVQGRYFEYQGNPIDILEGVGSERWLSLSDIRRTLSGLPRYAMFQKLYPEATKTEGSRPKEFIESLALVDYLKNAQDQNSLKFLHWLQREVVFPAEKRNALTTS